MAIDASGASSASRQRHKMGLVYHLIGEVSSFHPSFYSIFHCQLLVSFEHHGLGACLFGMLSNAILLHLGLSDTLENGREGGFIGERGHVLVGRWVRDFPFFPSYNFTLHDVYELMMITMPIPTFGWCCDC